MDWRYLILKKTGYSARSEATSGRVLEFIGTSGAGKTTLFNKSMVGLKKRWFFSYQIDYFKRHEPPCRLDEVLMQILQSRIESINRSELFCPWHSLLDLKLSVRVMHETMQLIHGTQPKGFAFDEGLFRHFSPEILALGDGIPTQLWQNRAFVYLQAREPDTVVSRVKSREQAFSQIERQRIRTDEQILAKLQLDQEVFSSILEKAAAYGCPVLVLDAEDPFEDSLARVLEFERSLSQQFLTQDQLETDQQLFSRSL